MFLRIFKFLLKTRFSRAFFGSLGLILFLDLVVLVPQTLNSGASLTIVQVIFAVLFYYMFLALTIIFGNGLNLTKPDQEFLLPSSVPKRDLAYALFLTQYVAFGLFFLILSLGLAFSYRSHPLTAILLVLDFIMLSSTVTSFSVALANTGKIVRIGILVVCSLLIFSIFFNFSFSPFAMLQGHIVTGTVSDIIFSAIPMFFAARWINREELTAREPRVTLRSKETYKDTVEFSGLSPRSAIFRNYFLHAYQGNSVAGMGQNFSRTTRIRLSAVLRVMVILSIVFTGLITYALTRVSSQEILPFEFIIIFYISLYPQMILFSTTFAVERIWLSGTSVRFVDYVRSFVFGQMLQAAVINIPLSVGFLFLYFVGDHYVLPVIFFELVVVPISVGVMVTLSIIARPPQVQESIIVTRRMGIRRAIYMLPYFSLVMTGFLSAMLYFPGSLVPVIIGVVLLAILLKSSERWNRIMSRLVEKNYI